MARAPCRSSGLFGRARVPRASLNIKDDIRAPEGQLSLQITRLADLDAVLGEALQGSLNASVAFERPGGRSRARLAVVARDVGLPAQRLASLQLSGDIDQPLRRPRLALQLSAAALVRGVDAKLSATITGVPNALSMRATAATGRRGSRERHHSSTAPPTWHGNQRRQLELTVLDARYRQQSAASAGTGRGLLPRRHCASISCDWQWPLPSCRSQGG